MKRAAGVCALVLCACAGVFAAALLSAPVAGADGGTGTDTTGTGTTTDTTTTTTDTTTTTAPPTPPKPPRNPRLIPAGVTVGGVLVGGLTAEEARAIVQKRFQRALPLVVSPTLTISVSPAELGAAAQVRKAVAKASRLTRRNVAVPLTVEVWESRMRNQLQRLDRRLRRDPVDATVRLHDLVPELVPAVDGRRLRIEQTARVVRQALRLNRRDPVELVFALQRPLVRDGDFDTVLVIRRETRKLFYYKNLQLKRVFRVATGQPSYPTPIGRFEVVNKQRNPWWYPPAGSAWAQGAKPVPPGPTNPLGTRWMGISAPYVGIHGTPNPASIGYSASHGCVRMLIPQVEWLFQRVDVGTPVFIVRA